MPGTEETPAVPQGPPGPRGLAGKGVSRREKAFAGTMLLLVLVMGAGALLSGYMQNSSWQQQYARGQQQAAATQRAQSALFVAKLCAIFEPIATLKAPSGDASNPSRLFDQHLEAKLALVAPLLGCKP